MERCTITWMELTKGWPVLTFLLVSRILQLVALMCYFVARMKYTDNKQCRCYLIIVVIITWPEKFDFVLVPEHGVTGILT